MEIYYFRNLYNQDIQKENITRIISSISKSLRISILNFYFCQIFKDQKGEFILFLLVLLKFFLKHLF